MNIRLGIETMRKEINDGARSSTNEAKRLQMELKKANQRLVDAADAHDQEVHRLSNLAAKNKEERDSAHARLDEALLMSTKLNDRITELKDQIEDVVQKKTEVERDPRFRIRGAPSTCCERRERC